MGLLYPISKENKSKKKISTAANRSEQQTNKNQNGANPSPTQKDPKETKMQTFQLKFSKSRNIGKKSNRYIKIPN